MLESVDMQFPEVKDESGNEQQLTHGNFSVFRESASADVRRESFEKYFGEFKKYINTWTAMYAGSVKVDCYYADVRGFDSACERALFSGNVPLSVYDNLVKSVHSGLPTMLEATFTPWEMNGSPLYRHLSVKANFSSSGTQILPGLLSELENDPKYAFLHSNPAYQQLIKKYRAKC